MSDRKREKVEDDPEAEPEEQLEGDEVADPELQEALDQVQDLQAQLDKVRTRLMAGDGLDVTEVPSRPRPRQPISVSAPAFSLLCFTYVDTLVAPHLLRLGGRSFDGAACRSPRRLPIVCWPLSKSTP